MVSSRSAFDLFFSLENYSTLRKINTTLKNKLLIDLGWFFVCHFAPKFEVFTKYKSLTTTANCIIVVDLFPFLRMFMAAIAPNNFVNNN
jgi:type III secretory pathway component EscT